MSGGRCVDSPAGAHHPAAARRPTSQRRVDDRTHCGSGPALSRHCVLVGEAGCGRRSSDRDAQCDHALQHRCGTPFGRVCRNRPAGWLGRRDSRRSTFGPCRSVRRLPMAIREDRIRGVQTLTESAPRFGPVRLLCLLPCTLLAQFCGGELAAVGAVLLLALGAFLARL